MVPLLFWQFETKLSVTHAFALCRVIIFYQFYCIALARTTCVCDCSIQMTPGCTILPGRVTCTPTWPTVATLASLSVCHRACLASSSAWSWCWWPPGCCSGMKWVIFGVGTLGLNAAEAEWSASTQRQSVFFAGLSDAPAWSLDQVTRLIHFIELSLQGWAMQSVDQVTTFIIQQVSVGSDNAVSESGDNIPHSAVFVGSDNAVSASGDNIHHSVL